MKKNNILLIIIFVFFFVGIVVINISWKENKKNELTKIKLGRAVLENDLEILKKNLRPEIFVDDSWVLANDYLVDPAKVINKENAKKNFQLSKLAVLDLTVCLKNNFCGMEKRNNDDAYFDENKTPAHILLSRYLSIMNECLLVDPELKKQINWKLINELTTNGNEMIQVLALEIIQKFGDIKNNLNEIERIVDNYKGQAKANALTKLSKREGVSSHALLLNSLEKSFMIDDPHTAISVIEKINLMNLTLDEVTKISKNLCHYKEIGIDDHNWKMIKYDMLKSNIDLEFICTN